MKIFEGICMMCKDPLLIDTISIDGRLRPLCPKCEAMVNKKTKQSMEKRGKKIRGKEMIFPSAK